MAAKATPPAAPVVQPGAQLTVADQLLCLLLADREHLRLTQQQFEGLPLSLVAQLAAAVVVAALGGLQVSGSFQPIRISDVPK
jgi:hypothetical protein